MKSIRIVIWGALLLVQGVQVLGAGERGIRIEPREAWSSMFGGREVAFHLDVSSVQAVRARVGWSFAVSGRVIARSECAVSAGPEKPATVVIRLSVPPLREGVSVRSTLRVTLRSEGEENAAAVWERTLWVLAEDPFAGRTEWLKERRLMLFDPAGETADTFRKAGIPFSRVYNVDALAGVGDGTLIIGQGVSFREYRALGRMVVEAAAGGIPVLCLAPRQGKMVIMGEEGSGLPVPRAVGLRRNDVITDMDKRLDCAAWAPDGGVVVGGVVLGTENGRLVGEATEGNRGWPWLEVRYDKGALLVCGFDIVGKWDASPSARYVLARILERLSKAPEEEDERR